MKSMLTTILILLGLSLPAYAGERQDKITSFEEKLSDARRNGQLPESGLGRILIVTLRSDQGQAETLKNQLADVLKRALDASVTICGPCFMTESAWLKDGAISRNYLDRQRISEIMAEHEEWGEISVFAYFHEDKDRLSWRLEDARSGDIINAGVVDQRGNWTLRTLTRSTLTEARERKAAGQPLMHTIFDLGAYPSAHIGFDFLEQWGEYNQRFTGVSLSIYNPTGGLGISHYQVIPKLGNTMVGAQFLINIPAVLASSADRESNDDDTENEQQFMLNIVARYPLTESGIWNAFIFVSTSASVGAGISWIGIDL